MTMVSMYLSNDTSMTHTESTYTNLGIIPPSKLLSQNDRFRMHPPLSLTKLMGLFVIRRRIGMYMYRLMVWMRMMIVRGMSTGRGGVFGMVLVGMILGWCCGWMRIGWMDGMGWGWGYVCIGSMGGCGGYGCGCGGVRGSTGCYWIVFVGRRVMGIIGCLVVLARTVLVHAYPWLDGRSGRR